ncbi:hypothetical protein NDA12_001888 [Ustilago hordei]|nr:hypothetical protein NDA12_001888 [Ustilago hordei]
MVLLSSFTTIRLLPVSIFCFPLSLFQYHHRPLVFVYECVDSQCKVHPSTVEPFSVPFLGFTIPHRLAPPVQ